jgi:hypothetical protein
MRWTVVRMKASRMLRNIKDDAEDLGHDVKDAAKDVKDDVKDATR